MEFIQHFVFVSKFLILTTKAWCSGTIADNYIDTVYTVINFYVHFFVVFYLYILCDPNVRQSEKQLKHY